MSDGNVCSRSQFGNPERLPMKLSFASQHHPTHLMVTVTGEQSREDAFAIIEMIAAEAKASGMHRILVDGRDLTNPLEPTDVFSIGERLAQVFGNRFRVALIYRAGFIDGFGETVAVNRGATFTVRASEEDAIAWLHSA